MLTGTRFVGIVFFMVCASASADGQPVFDDPSCLDDYAGCDHVSVNSTREADACYPLDEPPPPAQAANATTRQPGDCRPQSSAPGMQGHDVEASEQGTETIAFGFIGAPGLCISFDVLGCLGITLNDPVPPVPTLKPAPPPHEPEDVPTPEAFTPFVPESELPLPHAPVAVEDPAAIEPPPQRPVEEPTEVTPPQPTEANPGGWTLSTDPPAVLEPSPWQEIALAAVSLTILVALVPYVLYNRLTKDRVESHPLRLSILNLIRRSPGISTTDVARELAVDGKTALHHVRILARFGHIVVYADAKGPRYFENHGRFPAGLRAAIACLQRHGTRQMLHSFASTPGLRLTDVAGILKISLATASDRAKRLREAGLLSFEGRRWSVTPQAGELITNVRP